MFRYLNAQKLEDHHPDRNIQQEQLTPNRPYNEAFESVIIRLGQQMQNDAAGKKGVTRLVMILINWSPHPF